MSQCANGFKMAHSSQVFFLYHCKCIWIVVIYRYDLYFHCPPFSSTISESWIFILTIKNNMKRKNSKHWTSKKTLSPVSMVMAAWFLWGSDEFLFDFVLFMCAATPCCYDCSPLGQTGALISLFMPYHSSLLPVCMSSFWIAWSHLRQSIF